MASGMPLGALGPPNGHKTAKNNDFHVFWVPGGCTPSPGHPYYRFGMHTAITILLAPLRDAAVPEQPPLAEAC